MSSVRVAFSALPAHVRTARLIAIAVARRAGVADDLIDEVRLAVGEACSRAVTVNAGTEVAPLVSMVITDDARSFAIEVHDTGRIDPEAVEDIDELRADAVSRLAEAGSDGGPDALPPSFGLAVINGLVEDVNVDSGPDGTRVCMTWPVGATSAA